MLHVYYVEANNFSATFQLINKSARNENAKGKKWNDNIHGKYILVPVFRDFFLKCEKRLEQNPRKYSLMNTNLTNW